MEMPTATTAPVVPTTEPPSPTQKFPTKAPPGTSAVPSSIFEDNLAYAEKKNEEFKALSPGQQCSEPGAPACIGGDDYRCTDAGTFELNERCPSGMACYAVPWPYAEVVRVGCLEEEKAKELLRGIIGDSNGDNTENGGSDGENDGGSSQPAPSSEVVTPEPEPVATTTKTSTTIITKTAERPKPAATTSADPPPQIPKSDPPAPEPSMSSNPLPEISTSDAPASEPTMSSNPLPEPTPTTEESQPPSASEPTAGTTITDVIKDPSETDEPFMISFIGEDITMPLVPEPTSQPEEPKNYGNNRGGGSEDAAADDDGPASEDGAQPDSSTMGITTGTPTVSLYFTVTETVTEKERVTATLILPAERI